MGGCIFGIILMTGAAEGFSKGLFFSLFYFVILALDLISIYNKVLT